MSDELKSRLRKLEGGDKYGSTVWYRNPDGPEAVEYIEKLEAALRYIERHAGNPNIWYAKIARKALEGKDG